MFETAEWNRLIDESVLEMIGHRPAKSSHKWVNTEEYDIVPKKEFVKRQVKEKEEELRRIEAARDNSLRYYESTIGRINKQIEELKRKT